jgi:hypothetical protein
VQVECNINDQFVPCSHPFYPNQGDPQFVPHNKGEIYIYLGNVYLKILAKG